MEGMNQFGIQYICTWKCHNETPHIPILNKQKSLFFKNKGQEGKTDPSQELVPVGAGGEDIKKGCIIMWWEY
jgi:hypothetical protein